MQRNATCLPLAECAVMTRCIVRVVQHGAQAERRGVQPSLRPAEVDIVSVSTKAAPPLSFRVSFLRVAPSGTLAERSANKSARPWLSAAPSGWLGDRTRSFYSLRIVL